VVNRPIGSLVRSVTAPPLTTAAWLRSDAVARALDRVRPERVLEVGAGRGAMGWRLARRCTSYVGLEPDPDSFAVARERLAGVPGAEMRNGDVGALAAGEVFDLVCAFEVLEHVEDDAGELRRWAAHLRAPGWLLLSVPAHQSRFGPTDEAVGHVRRYDRRPLVATLEAGGFRPVETTAWGAGAGHLLEWARDRITTRRPAPSTQHERTARSGRFLQPSSRLAGAATAVLAAPGRVVQRPFARTDTGIGWVVLARRT
jgi:SAM-dependent methyltransferase